MNIVLIGPQASGKGTQAEKLIEKFGLFYIEMGGLCRKVSKEETSLGKEVKTTIEAGRLIPDEIAIEILKNHLDQLGRLEGLIIDGFPRAVSQAEYFEKFLAEKGKKIDLVIYLDLPREETFKRLVNRRMCESCGKTFNLLTKPSKRGDLCDNCGGRLIIRSDETPEKINIRLDLFEKQSKSVVEFFDKKGILEKVDGNRPIEEIFQDIVLRINKRGLA